MLNPGSNAIFHAATKQGSSNSPRTFTHALATAATNETPAGVASTGVVPSKHELTDDLTGNQPNMADATLRLLQGDALELPIISFEGDEKLGQLFEFRIHVAVERDLVEVIHEDALVGQRATLTLHSGQDRKRAVHGLISRSEYVGVAHSHAFYVFVLSPPAWPLTQRVNCRIFQDLSTPEIIAAVFKDHGIGDRGLKFALKEKYAPRNYCVQYRESDWNFIQRLMQEEGMYHFYHDREDEPVLHITDGPHGHFDVSFGRNVAYHAPDGMTPVPNTVFEAQTVRQIRPGRVVQTDYAARKPSMPLHTLAVEDRAGAEVFDYPGEYRDKRLGRRLTETRLQEARTGMDLTRGHSVRPDFAPGHRFQLHHHPIRRLNRPLLLTQIHHLGITPMAADIGYTTYSGALARPAAHGEIRPSYENRFEAIPASQIFRPARDAYQPRVAGPQTAVVVGPEGEEIYTDKYGRVKVQFRWDREGRRDERSSCWIRVSQPWAGPGFGGIAIPRVGQEVIVDFLEGDPDQPIITGRVFNGEHMPPVSLPDAKACTSIKSNSYPGGGGSNEITMNDTAGQEHFYIHAQYDMARDVGNNCSTNIGNNRTTAVGVNSTETIGTDRMTAVGANSVETVGANLSLDVGANASETVGAAKVIDVGSTLLINAGTSITLQCGASTIHMNQAGFITISGVVVTVAGAANCNMSAPITNVTGAAMLTNTGALNLSNGVINRVHGSSLGHYSGGSKAELVGGETVVQGGPVKIN